MDGRTPDHGHPISSPCEPNGSGELIKSALSSNRVQWMDGWMNGCMDGNHIDMLISKQKILSRFLKIREPFFFTISILK